MKYMVLFLTLAMATHPVAHADDTLETEEQLDLARAKLGAGVALTLVAALLGATGGGLLATDHGQFEIQAKQGALALGISSAVLGAVGIPLAIVGGRQLRALKKRKLVVAPASMQISF